MHRRSFALATALVLALPTGVAAQQAAKGETLRQPIVVRMPTTFSAPATSTRGQTPAGAAMQAELEREYVQTRLQRASDEAAFVKKFGYGIPVRLRARKY